MSTSHNHLFLRISEQLKDCPAFQETAPTMKAGASPVFSKGCGDLVVSWPNFKPGDIRDAGPKVNNNTVIKNIWLVDSSAKTSMFYHLHVSFFMY
jgi:hypothetical protein